MAHLMKRELKAPTPTLTLYRRALLRGKHAGEKRLPDISVTLRRQRADAGKLEQYNNACGFLSGREMPAIYPHILAFPLHMELMTDAQFPFPLLGLVHISNRITRHRAITISDELDITCRFGALEAHEKGTAFSVLTEASTGGRKVWESSSTMLHRHATGGAGEKKADSAADDMSGATRETWKIADDMGRRYGRASGDMNPIHLWPLTARAFGFKRHIVHGMWTKARAVAALTPQIGARPFTVDVAFKLPVFLPADVTFLHKAEDKGIRFEVRDRENIKPHLKGGITFLD